MKAPNARMEPVVDFVQRAENDRIIGRQAMAILTLMADEFAHGEGIFQLVGDEAMGWTLEVNLEVELRGEDAEFMLAFLQVQGR